MHFISRSHKTAKPREVIFEIDSLSFSYPDGHQALEEISLTISHGDRVALVGHNGAGKTTLIKHFNGLYKPQTGLMHYKGQELEGEHLRRARLEIGVLFQDPDDQLFCNTLYDDVAFGPANQGLRGSDLASCVNRALQEMDLEGLAYKPPHQLSYGQKKRAALATILAMNPEVLIVDEPTANLDPKQERIFLDLLSRFSGTLICISHDLPFLYQLCTRAVVMTFGRIHHDYTMKELVSDRNYLREHGLDFTFRFSCCRDSGREHEHVPLFLKKKYSPVSKSAVNLSGAADSGQRVNRKREAIDSPTPLIEMHGYSYRYPDGTWACRDIDLVISRNESVALVGENGAGKSTLVSCIMGILQGRGEYRFEGCPITAQNRRVLWSKIGMVFQDPADQLFCPSCWEEVAFGPRQQGLESGKVSQRVREALDLVRLEGYDQRVPHHLSAGERKRLAIATVLSMNPEVLILDEPTANLDAQSEELLFDILMNLNATKIIITHDIFLITALCKRTVVIHRGRIIRDYPTKKFEKDEHLVSVNGLDYHFKNACCMEILGDQGNTGYR